MWILFWRGGLILWGILFSPVKVKLFSGFSATDFISSIKWSVLLTDNRCVEWVCCSRLWLICLRGKEKHTRKSARWQKWDLLHPWKFFWAYGPGDIPPCFPLCPAKLIQEWLSSSDSICRQTRSCLKYPVCAHWSGDAEKHDCCLLMLIFMLKLSSENLAHRCSDTFFKGFDLKYLKP